MLKIFPCLQRVLSQTSIFQYFYYPCLFLQCIFVTRVDKQFSLDCCSSFTSTYVYIIYKSTVNFIRNTQLSELHCPAEWESGDGERWAVHHIHLMSPGPRRWGVVRTVICSCHEITECYGGKLRVPREQPGGGAAGGC